MRLIYCCIDLKDKCTQPKGVLINLRTYLFCGLDNTTRFVLSDFRHVFGALSSRTWIGLKKLKKVVLEKMP